MSNAVLCGVRSRQQKYCVRDSTRKILNMAEIFKGGKTNEKDCVDNFIVGFDLRIGRVPTSLVVVSWRRPWWSP